MTGRAAARRPHGDDSAAARPRPDPLRGAVAGLVAGLVASLAMDLAQKALAALQPSTGGSDDEMPATEKAADRIAGAVGAAPLPRDEWEFAGQAVHYAFGGLLGLGYGIAAEYAPRITAGGGSGFALGTAGLFDELAVPAAGLGDAPWEADLATHAYAFASHLVFGTVTEGTRRLIRAAI